jgi:hypothetical protein
MWYLITMYTPSRNSSVAITRPASDLVRGENKYTLLCSYELGSSVNR